MTRQPISFGLSDSVLEGAHLAAAFTSTGLNFRKGSGCPRSGATAKSKEIRTLEINGKPSTTSRRCSNLELEGL